MGTSLQIWAEGSHNKPYYLKESLQLSCRKLVIGGRTRREKKVKKIFQSEQCIPKRKYPTELTMENTQVFILHEKKKKKKHSKVLLMHGHWLIICLVGIRFGETSLDKLCQGHWWKGISCLTSQRTDYEDNCILLEWSPESGGCVCFVAQTRQPGSSTTSLPYLPELVFIASRIFLISARLPSSFVCCQQF